MTLPSKGWKWTSEGVSYRFQPSSMLDWEATLVFTVACVHYRLNLVFAESVDVGVKTKWYKPMKWRVFSIDKLPAEIKQDVDTALEALKLPVQWERERNESDTTHFLRSVRHEKDACK